MTYLSWVSNTIEGTWTIYMVHIYMEERNVEWAEWVEYIGYVNRHVNSHLFLVSIDPITSCSFATPLLLLNRIGPSSWVQLNCPPNSILELEHPGLPWATTWSSKFSALSPLFFDTLIIHFQRNAIIPLPWAFLISIHGCANRFG